MRINKKHLRGLLAVPLLLSMLVAGCTNDPAPAVPSSEPTESTEVTVPAPTAPPDGNPDDVTCQGSYSVTAKNFISAADTVVATLADATLTNRELQILYSLEISGYLQENPHAEFSFPLDTLLQETDTGLITWQQYFLQRSLNTWANQQALVLLAKQEGLPTDPSYQPIAEKHSTHVSPELPALKYFYGYAHENYAPNEKHQAWLDALPELLDSLAEKNNYADASALVQDLAGPGATVDDLVSCAYLMNWAYSYFTDRIYYIEPTDDEIDAYFAAHEETYLQQGITRDSGSYVDMRHILLIPNGASVDASGVVTCSEDAWDSCKITAQTVLNDSRYSDAQFAEAAFAKSQDPGSQPSGGLYSRLHQGQLTAVLDTWLFDPAREPGDTEIIRSDCGYHVVRFKESTPIWYVHAREDLIRQQALELTEQFFEENSLTVSYADICLTEAPLAGSPVTANDLLYPDVAHERFPSAPIYLQQDYPDTMYGGYPISTHGCGITTMAMLATYMTDEEWTPPELCALYGRFCSETGTDYKLFEVAPAELGFYMEESIYSNWDRVWEILESGRVVANLQYKGYWTRAGHFLLLQQITEEGTVVTRDSNILNYDRIADHMKDAHTKESFLGTGYNCWAYQEKVIRIAACARCGEEDQGVPFSMFADDYLCSKCIAATARRESFLLAREAPR